MNDANRVSQFYYTSSKRGYGVYAESPDIKLDEKNQITVNIAYKRPQRLIDSNEKDLNKFPVKVTRFKISNHKWVLARSNYLGLDNTGRDGNFFSHVLLFENVDSLKKSYFQYKFKDGLTPEEQEITNPSPLGFVSEPIHDQSEIRKFAKKNAKAIPRFIEALFVSLRQKKKLAIVDSNENVFLWIQLLHELVPINLVKDLEFSTYVERITSGFDIVGIFDEELLRDTSRIVPFGKNDHNLEISELAENLTEDYLNETPRQLFHIVSNSYKRDELIQKLPELYATLANNDVTKDDFLKEVKPLEKSNVTLAQNVLSYLVQSKILAKLEIQDIRSISQFIRSAYETKSFYEFMYQAIFQGSYDNVEYLFKDFSDYSLSVTENIKSRDLNEYVQYYIILDYSERIKKNFNISILKEATNRAVIIHEKHPQRSKSLVKLLLRHSLYSFDSRDVSDTDAYSEMLSYIATFWSNQDEIKREVQEILIEATKSNINKNLVTNIIYFLIVLNSVKTVSEVFSEYQQGRTSEKYLELLDIYYRSISNLSDEKNARKRLYEALEDLYLYLFDKYSHYAQKKFYANYKMAFQRSPHYKPNYILIFSSVFAGLFILFSGGLFYSSLQPTLTLTLNEETKVVEWYNDNTIGQILSVSPKSRQDDLDYLIELRKRISLPGHAFNGYGINPLENRMVISYRSIDNGSIRDYYLDIIELESLSDNDSKPTVYLDGQRIDQPIVLDFEFNDLSQENFQELILLKLDEMNFTINDNLLNEIQSDEILQYLYQDQVQSINKGILKDSGQPYRFNLRGLNLSSSSFVSNKRILLAGNYKNIFLQTNDFAGNSSQLVPIEINVASMSYILNKSDEIFFDGDTINYFENEFPSFTGINPEIALDWMNLLLIDYLTDEYDLNEENIRNIQYDIDNLTSSFDYEGATYSIPLINQDIDLSLNLTIEPVTLNSSGLTVDNYINTLELQVLIPLRNSISNQFLELATEVLGSDNAALANIDDYFSVNFEELESTLLDESGVLLTSGQFQITILILNKFEPVQIILPLSFELTIVEPEIPIETEEVEDESIPAGNDADTSTQQTEEDNGVPESSPPPSNSNSEA